MGEGGVNERIVTEQQKVGLLDRNTSPVHLYKSFQLSWIAIDPFRLLRVSFYASRPNHAGCQGGNESLHKYHGFLMYR
jgi:hypothetical protein